MFVRKCAFLCVDGCVYVVQCSYACGDWMSAVAYASAPEHPNATNNLIRCNDEWAVLLGVFFCMCAYVPLS